MFLRRCKRRKNGKDHTYWALVESIRTERGSRQRMVAYLGELADGEPSGWAKLGRRLEAKARPQPTLFDPPHYDDPDEDEPVLVNLKGVRLERVRDFGDVWLAWGLWRLLGLDKLLERLMPEGKEDVRWPLVAAILVIGRFCEPGSELHIEEVWYPRTALDDLLGVEAARVNTDRLYAALDLLLPHKEAIEKHLKERLGDLFELEYDLLLYDITSTYFEGECRANPMAQRGHSRDRRPDCLQVCIGLVVTTDGMPLGYEVFDGNRGDATTVQEIVKAMEAKYGRANRIWVLDRGMVSEENLAYIRQRGGAYIVGTPKSMLRRFEQRLVEEDWQEVQAGVEVKLAPGPDGAETFILARSRDRQKKERAIHERFFGRMEEGLAKLQAAMESGRLKDLPTACRRLGRLQQRCWRSAGAFQVEIQPLARSRGKAKLSITWKVNRRWTEWAALSEGCYLLRTNLRGLDAATLWKRYIQLTDAEWGFRITKDELEVRPIWHQKPERVLAHILVCFLGYALWKALSQWMHRASLGEAPRALLAEFAKIKSGDVVLPTRPLPGRPVRGVRLRCVTAPDEAQKVLLNRLGLRLPQRLRRLEEVVQM